MIVGIALLVAGLALMVAEVWLIAAGAPVLGAVLLVMTLATELMVGDELLSTYR